MTKQNSRIRFAGLPKLSWRRFDGWTLAAALVALVVMAPMISVVWIAFHPTENIWPHLLATVLPRYFTATLRL
ncbi:MAG: iron ABC transporter permease, partial [Cypionkella sp.]